MGLATMSRFNSGEMNQQIAIRVAKFHFGPVKHDRGEGSAWTYTTHAPGARTSLSRDYLSIVRCRNREIVRYCLVLLGWRDVLAREFADQDSGRGTSIHTQIKRAENWKREKYSTAALAKCA
jgi:hypothetical protein